MPPTATPTITPTPTPVDVIFANGFETGTLAAWSQTSIDGGDLSVSPIAALGGTSQGLRVLIDDNRALWVRDNTPTAERRYRARFLFDPNSIAMLSGNAHPLFQGLNASGAAAVTVEFRRSNGQYGLRLLVRLDSGLTRATSWFTISDAPHTVEFDWVRSTAAGAVNGTATFYIDGAQAALLTGVDNDIHMVESALLGPATGIDTGTRGTYFLDEFVSRRATLIGPPPLGVLSATGAEPVEAEQPAARLFLPLVITGNSAPEQP